ncbi:thermostable phytase [Paraphaeosphaeria sporulosa]|uniref:Thermostable phytase n=1 Tax=Paraphaeosphaeria sporulosa TaxID=1460663 RepID=A0A177CCD5_9PLEO|nr:thermostable phytase [Paraphaeosphaeria sporulosa]OAG04457.1 thermostable phytase [Paraphaeosphaeria sporulosa]
MGRRACFLAFASLIFQSLAQNANITLTPAAVGFEADNTAFYYSSSPLLLANDGSAAGGGFRVFDGKQNPQWAEVAHLRTGRSKVAIPVYNIGGRDIVVTIAATDSNMRAFEANGLKEIKNARKPILGDWSTLCGWQSASSGNSYLLLFGKRIVVQLLVRNQSKRVEILAVQTFPTPIEGESCAVFRDGTVFFSAEDQPLYSFTASESFQAPEIKILTKEVPVLGLAAYHADSEDFLLVVDSESLHIYDRNLNQKNSALLTGIPDLSVEGGLSILQSTSKRHPSGLFAFAFEGEEDTGVAIGSLQAILGASEIRPNTKFDPNERTCRKCTQPISKRCSNNGYNQHGICQCFPGFGGGDCSKITCQNSCSGHGSCIGPNICKCAPGRSGPDCSFVAVKAKYETDANGGDGDDPAIWIHPTRPDQSRIVTTTKSDEGAGFAVFNLNGKLLQHVPGEEPNNVDVIYNFTVGAQVTDLTFAACRGDNTLCLLKINSTGFLESVDGGIQPTPEDYEVYGSCTYRSPTSGRQYLFVNNKDAEYLQYELRSTANGTLETNLVRKFVGGSGGQVEGCVCDEEQGYLFLGEEPEGLWRYDAEPNGSSTGIQIARVGDGTLYADVEGVTLVPAKNSSDGYLFVSSQGRSAYLVYERAPPHAYVMTFTIVDNKEAGIDHVSNTDGIAAVGNRLNSDFPKGLFVTHDDANELAGRETADQASFKLVSLEDILGKQRAAQLGY